jgi:hypothetical protein
VKRTVRAFIFFLSIFPVGHVLAAEAIINASVSEAGVSRAFLLSVFSMRVNRWPDGLPIHVFVLPDDHPDHVLFVKSRLQVFPYQLRNTWDRAVFSGSGQSPHIVHSVDEMLERVRTVKGSIGYINRDLEGEQGVKTLEVY